MTTTLHSEPETYRGAAASIRRIATESFAQHELRETGPNEWRCGRPNTGTYAFRVILRPGVAIIYGDIGEGVFRAGDQDMLGWLRGAVHSPEYLLEKLRTSDRSGGPRRFYPGDAFASLRLHVEEQPDEPKWRAALDEAERLERWGEFDEGGWTQIVKDHLDWDCDLFGLPFDHPSSDLWLVEALRCFVRLEAGFVPAGVPATTGGED